MNSTQERWKASFQKPKARLFIDLDGVLADFDKGYEKAFGVELLPRAERQGEDVVKWHLIRNTPGFFRHLPMMPGALQLWNFASRQGAYILSGAPDREGSNVQWEKRMWVKKNLGDNVPVITCPASEKSLYARPGDVLVDDWEKHMAKWQAAGGVWITYKDHVQAIEALRALGYE
jgi:5'(3')-deoxyribonucleotidase